MRSDVDLRPAWRRHQCF